jgi:hypothetical protein
VTSSSASANAREEVYWLKLRPDGVTWCGYALDDRYPRYVAAEKVDVREMYMPGARISFSSEKVSQVSYRSASKKIGDWLVIDDYEPSGKDWLLRRGILLMQRKSQRLLSIAQHTTVHRGKAEPFHVANVSRIHTGPEEGDPTVDPTQKVDPSTLGLPPVPVITDLPEEPFMQIAFEMRRRSLGKLCKTGK